MDLLPSSHLPLPLELNCEIFKCLKLPVQRKFIWGLGRDIYGIFGQKTLKKTKRVCNPHGNRWNGTNTTATIAADGLSVSNEARAPHVFAEQPFSISGPQCRMDKFPGTIMYYYEVKGDVCYLGLFSSDGAIINDVWIDDSNSYAFPIGFFYHCWLAGELHEFELPEGAIRPNYEHVRINVHGCGLVLDPVDKLCIFFTLNGKLKGRKIPISPTVDRLIPAVTMIWNVSSFETNFGDDPVQPFLYDIHNCPGLGLACI